MRTKRIFMNEADASPGNGAPAASPSNPESTAAPTAQALDVDALVTRFAAIVDEKVTAVRSEHNAAFAKLRKDGQLKKDDPPAPVTQASPPASISLADVEAMLERERVLTRVATEHKLSDAQVKRMKGLLAAEKPEDVSTWVSSFVTDMGLVRQAESTTVTPNPQPTSAPVSDKGSPAPGGVVNWERELAENPIGMSPAARALMDARFGPDEGRRKRLEAARGQAQRIKVTTH